MGQHFGGPAQRSEGVDMQVDVKIDARDLLRWASDLSASKFKLAAKNALNRGARAARTQAVKDIARDANVPTSRIKPGVGPLRTASPSNLVASWSATKVRVGIMNTAGASIATSGGLTASTFALSGGGSAALRAPKAFIMRANGGTFVVVRKGKGRNDLKGVYAEAPNTAMRQENSMPRTNWTRNATTNIKRELETGLQAVLNRGSPPSDTGSNTD